MARMQLLLVGLILGLSPLAAVAQEQGLGDWCGKRTALANCGITFDMDVANFYSGVTKGGLDRRFDYGGHGDYVMNADLGKVCGCEGLFLKVRAEHRFGQNVNSNTGAILPANVLADLPVRGEEDLLLTNVLFTQMLSKQFAVFCGKLDTFDGDMNAFASGRGKTQFSNIGFVINPIALRTIPYSTLGCGFAILGEEGTPIFSYTLLNAVDTAEKAGFDELFAEGVAMSAEMRLPTRFGGKPGHQLFGATWNSRDYVALGQDPRVVLPNIPINRTDGSWSAYWNFDQYLYVDPCNPQQGWGLFGRAGVADDSANPLGWFLSFGIGGNNPCRCHAADTFGVGWFMAGSSDEIGPLLQATLGPIGDGQGFEFYYNWQAKPWLNITPDVQVLVPARENIDSAVVAGIRAVVNL